MSFPEFISLTVTNRCNLKCQMCGQWSENGYMHEKNNSFNNELNLSDWKRIVDELAGRSIGSVLIRGGEPFLYPGIMELIETIRNKGIFISIDTNGTMLLPYSERLVRLGKLHLTFSIDGTEAVHDRVRGVKGSFQKTRENIKHLIELDKENRIGKSITFTISRFNYQDLGKMPDVARDLGVKTVCIVPYYFIPVKTGKKYENELFQLSGCKAFSWKGFQHENSGVEEKEFLFQLNKFKTNLKEITSYPYIEIKN